MDIQVIYLPDDKHYLEITKRDWVMFKGRSDGSVQRQSEDYARRLLEEFPQPNSFQKKILGIPYLEKLAHRTGNIY